MVRYGIAMRKLHHQCRESRPTSHVVNYSWFVRKSQRHRYGSTQSNIKGARANFFLGGGGWAIFAKKNFRQRPKKTTHNLNKSMNWYCLHCLQSHRYRLIPLLSLGWHYHVRYLQSRLLWCYPACNILWFQAQHHPMVPCGITDRVTLNNSLDYLTNGHYRTYNPTIGPLTQYPNLSPLAW